ncbi:MAG: hypothetical protein WC307_04605 [Candidatus Nanoarchaeia archaeon]|jgi:hypothetical protein
MNFKLLPLMSLLLICGCTNQQLLDFISEQNITCPQICDLQPHPIIDGFTWNITGEAPYCNCGYYINNTSETGVIAIQSNLSIGRAVCGIRPDYDVAALLDVANTGSQPIIGALTIRFNNESGVVYTKTYSDIKTINPGTSVNMTAEELIHFMNANTTYNITLLIGEAQAITTCRTVSLSQVANVISVPGTESTITTNGSANYNQTTTNYTFNIINLACTNNNLTITINNTGVDIPSSEKIGLKIMQPDGGIIQEFAHDFSGLAQGVIGVSNISIPTAINDGNYSIGITFGSNEITANCAI